MAQSSNFGGVDIIIQHNNDFKVEAEQNPTADKKQKIDEKVFKNLFKSREFGEEKYVIFYSDGNKSKQYSDTILEHIPVLKAAYDGGKESKIKLDSKFIDILPWIVSIYDERSFRFILNTISKTDKIYDIDIYSILEFINKYMVTSQNTIEKLCISNENMWFYDMIYECLYNSQDNNYVKYLCKTINDNYDIKFQTPYVKLLDDTINMILMLHIKNLYVGNQNTEIKIADASIVKLTAINTTFNYNMIRRIPDKYRTDFLINILKEIDNITNNKKQFIKPATVDINQWNSHGAFGGFL
jgi:hypothetical protein